MTFKKYLNKKKENPSLSGLKLENVVLVLIYCVCFPSLLPPHFFSLLAWLLKWVIFTAYIHLKW